MITYEEHEILKKYWLSIGRDEHGAPKNEDRQGYSVMFQDSIWKDLSSLELNDIFHEIEHFMCDDIRRCTILDWRADLAPHCLKEREYGACEGNYLWTVYCPVRRCLTLIRWHFNWCYA